MSNVLSLRDSISTDIKNTMVSGGVEKREGLKVGATALALAPSALSPVFAAATGSGVDAFFNVLSEKLQGIYTAMSKYVHVFATVLMSIAILVRLFSKNPRSIEEANGWMKNIAITWLMFNMISIFVGFMGDFKTDQYNKPWGTTPGKN